MLRKTRLFLQKKKLASSPLVARMFFWFSPPPTLGSSLTPRLRCFRFSFCLLLLLLLYLFTQIHYIHCHILFLSEWWIIKRRSKLASLAHSSRSPRSNAEDSSMNTFYLFAPQPVKVFAVISTLCACFPLFLALLRRSSPPLDDDGVEQASRLF